MIFQPNFDICINDDATYRIVNNPDERQPGILDSQIAKKIQHVIEMRLKYEPGSSDQYAQLSEEKQIRVLQSLLHQIDQSCSQDNPVLQAEAGKIKMLCEKTDNFIKIAPLFAEIKDPKVINQFATIFKHIPEIDRKLIDNLEKIFKGWSSDQIVDILERVYPFVEDMYDPYEIGGYIALVTMLPKDERNPNKLMQCKENMRKLISNTH
ncbi:MAG: hypothetical protein WAM28_05220 [Chlamydiales bacterium]